MGRRRNLQRLPALRLAHDRHLDGQRSVRLALQPPYDLFYMAGVPLESQRVASPFISQAISSLHLYKAIDPDTWGRMIGRVNGANFAALYGRTAATGWQSVKLPKGMTWEGYMHFCSQRFRSGHGITTSKAPSVSIRFWREKGGCLPDENHRKAAKRRVSGLKSAARAPTGRTNVRCAWNTSTT